ncbi:MAG: hypothetical protein WBK77_07535 [Alphaproteobacteria bacterium]
MKLEKKLGDAIKKTNNELHLNLSLSQEEFRCLDAMLKAGLIIDPIIRDVDQETTRLLSEKISKLQDFFTDGDVQIDVTEQEMLHLVQVITSVNAMDQEIYFPDTTLNLPNDDDMDKFSEKLWNTWKQECTP